MFHKTTRAAIGIAVLFFTLSSAIGFAAAQDRRQNEPGKFDFYVLSLSWSPTYCEAASERGPRRSSDHQCSTARPFSFVVHGLWPQYENGFPEFCRRDAQRPDRNTVSSMLDLMPSPGLIFHEWERHGSCSGLSPRAYFETVRRVRAGVKIPEEYLSISEHRTVSPGDVEEAFVKANPGMSRNGISVACNDRKRLGEVRICLSRDLGFRDCAEVDRRACRAQRLIMPPVRGGRAASLIPAAER